jgi:GDPmannose 4,6-dehydratase
MQRLKAIVTGVFGQDGSYLAKALLEEGYLVYGTGGRWGTGNSWRLNELGILENPGLEILKWDITNPAETSIIIGEIKPDELFNLASHSYVGGSLDLAHETTLVSASAPVSILDAITQLSPRTKFFQAGSSEMFGIAAASPQSEETSFRPRNIYGSSKLVAHMATESYRSNAGIFGTEAILYNHESPLRSTDFVTRKISSSVARISLGDQNVLKIGNLSAIRDWGYAPEYVEAMRRIISHNEADYFVISSGIATSVREFVRLCFEVVDIEVAFEGDGLLEIGFEKASGRQLVKVSAEFFRKAENVNLIGDSSKARAVLGWKPRTSVQEIATLMVKHDLERNFISKG